jgi:hypothetical protein
MLRRPLLQLACIFSLLAAQQTALTHSVWHLRDYLPAHAHHDHSGAAHEHDDDESPSSQAELCIFHAALGSVFAGGCATKPVLETAAVPGWLAISPAVWRVAQAVALPPSRAPPVLL